MIKENKEAAKQFFMEEKHVLLSVSLHDAVPVGGSLDDTAMADIIAGTLRLHVAMGVIKMKYGQTLLG